MGESCWESNSVKNWVGVGRFIEKSGNGLFLFKNGWESIVFVGKWVGVCLFCSKIGGSAVFFEKWVRVGHYCRNKGRSVLFLSKNGW